MVTFLFMPRCVNARIFNRYQQVRVQKDELFAEYKEMLDTLNDLDMNKTLCHGDLHVKNMVYDEETGEWPGA